jgi:hypothetical protein
MSVFRRLISIIPLESQYVIIAFLLTICIYFVSCLQKGSLCRTTGSTDMNLTSSRSHAIFSIVLRQEIPPDLGNTENEPGNLSGTMEVRKLNSKFHFVDLAGSDRVCFDSNVL